ncbi:hypothetical protein DAEQUDRAFT_715485 [Daedalea quercina L-15889]|uniref:F-box domain-containing protein n=1 Tax=Daedalea quercina L-15889 TaxID=1314783 RepID=A0A165MUW8_9APHY|nr:hypothetical protein DAEQUDRAFT_715485 [Daedalea quercina L-15889]
MHCASDDVPDLQVPDSTSSATPCFVPRLPLDICYAVIDAFQSQCQWLHTLSACALVHRDWYAHCHYHLDKVIFLSSREQARRLFKRLRCSGNSRHLVEHVSVVGSTREFHNQPAPQLGTFATMLARLLPNLERFTLVRVDWRIGMVQPKDIGFLAAFRTVTCLELVDVHFRTISSFAHLLSALPSIHTLTCDWLHSDEEHVALPLPHVAHCGQLRGLTITWSDWHIATVLANLWTVAPAVETLALALYGGDLALGPPGGYWPCQQLHDVYSSSLNELTLLLDHNQAGKIALPADLSHHSKLTRISIGHVCSVTPPDFSWIAPVLSTVSSRNITHICISFRANYHNGKDIRHYIQALEDTRVLRHLDDVVMHGERFTGLSRQSLLLEIKVGAKGHEDLGEVMKSRGGWEAFVKREMPQSSARGIPKCIQTTVADYEDILSVR